MGEHPVKSFKKLLVAVAIGAAMSATMVAAPAQAVPHTLSAVGRGSTEASCWANLANIRADLINKGFNVYKVNGCKKYKTGWEGSVIYKTL